LSVSQLQLDTRENLVVCGRRQGKTEFEWHQTFPRTITTAPPASSTAPTNTDPALVPEQAIVAPTYLKSHVTYVARPTRPLPNPQSRTRARNQSPSAAQTGSKKTSVAQATDRREQALIKMGIGLAIFPIFMVLLCRIPSPLKLLGLLGLWGACIYACSRLLKTAVQQGMPTDRSVRRVAYARTPDAIVALTIGAPFVVMLSWFAIGFGEFLSNRNWERINEGQRSFWLIFGILVQVLLVTPVFMHFRNRCL